MTKKRFVAILLCVTLVALAAIGATFAYLTDSKTVKNTFTVGDVKIKLDETNVNAPEGDRVTSNTYNVYPGAVVTKDPIVHNTGKNGAYVRAVVTIEDGMNWLGLYNENVWTAPQEAAFNAMINNTLGEGWELVDIAYDMSGPNHPTSDFVATLKYTKVLEAGKDTTAMFSQIAFPTKLTGKDVTTRIGQNGEFGINVVAQAIQADGFENWVDAFAAYDAK
ncbi:MAG: TasA family protein [Christensenellaceae bacterium]|jgi:predicted ribosomally synthesized peptide with SipW-like signal peptide